jgi:hypothetical protein
MMRRIVALYSGAVALCGVMCGHSPSPISGPSTEQGNPQIVAIVVDNVKRPVPQALVCAYRVPPNADSTNQPSEGILVAQSKTDSTGASFFENLVPGLYSIKAIDPDSTQSSLKTNISVSNSKPMQPDYHDTLILTTPGSVRGIVTRGGFSTGSTNRTLLDGFIQVKIGEIDRSTITGPDGAYSFLNLPTGLYTLYYYATDGFYCAKRENIVVRPAKDTLLDSVFLKPRTLPSPKGFQAAYDTASGLVRFSWQKVNYDGFWYYSLQRKCISSPVFDTLFTSFDTLFVDSLKGVPAETVLYFVIQSVDKALNESSKTGPIEIKVAGKR